MRVNLCRDLSIHQEKFGEVRLERAGRHRDPRKMNKMKMTAAGIFQSLFVVFLVLGQS